MWLVDCNCLLNLLHIVEQTERLRCVTMLKLGTYEPNCLYIPCFKHIHNFLMLAVTNLSKLFHITNNHHFVLGLDLGKVV